MQTHFAERVGKPFALERGIQGSKARHERVSRFYGAMESPVPELPTPTYTEHNGTQGRQRGDQGQHHRRPRTHRACHRATPGPGTHGQGAEQEDRRPSSGLPPEGPPNWGAVAGSQTATRGARQGPAVDPESSGGSRRRRAEVQGLV
jgi:hypothetical protein